MVALTPGLYPIRALSSTILHATEERKTRNGIYIGPVRTAYIVDSGLPRPAVGSWGAREEGETL